MHDAFDAWMAREFPAVRFERYCDDVVVHCETLEQAHRLRNAIAVRLAECGGAAAPEKDGAYPDYDRRGPTSRTTPTCSA